jgi:O-antigen/teichoic acid export membrane protein
MPGLVGDGLWTIAAKIVSQAAQLAIFVLAARLLTPAEFGFFAFSAAIAVLLATLAENGLGEFVMKAPEGDGTHDQVATLALVCGAIMTFAGLAISLFVYTSPHMAWEGTLLALFCLWLVPAALTAVYDGRLIARGMIRAQSCIRIIGELTSLGVVAGGLFAGWNVFALVAGRLAMQVTVFLGAALALRWLPRLSLTRAFAREVLSFSRHILANRLIIFARSYSGTLAIGAFLGLNEAGFYRAAERIVAAFSELVGEPARMLAWMVFRKAAGDGENNGGGRVAVGNAATRFMTILLAVSAPIYIGLALASGSLVHFILGTNWAPVALLVTILSSRQIFLVCGYITEALLSLAGTIAHMPRVIFLNGIVSVGLMVVLAPFGVLAAALGQAAASLVSIWTSVLLQGRHGGLDWKRVFRDSAPTMAATIAMVIAVALVGHIAWKPAAEPAIVVTQIAAGGLTYCAVLFLLARRMGGALGETFGFTAAKPEKAP